MRSIIRPVSDVPLDAIAFCELIARILYRCLKDQEARLLLFPVVPEHPLSVTQEDGQCIPEMSH